MNAMKLILLLFVSPAYCFVSQQRRSCIRDGCLGRRFVSHTGAPESFKTQDDRDAWRSSDDSRSAWSPAKPSPVRTSLPKPPYRKPSTRRRSSMTSSMARLMEQQVNQAVQILSSTYNETAESASSRSNPLIPSIRDCNSALARLGDDGEMLRALRLFGKMRRLSLLLQRHKPTVRATSIAQSPSSIRPNLVTYSTLMSRFNRMKQPLVSIRLFRLLRNDRIQPDTKACNILMNSYVQLKQLDMALAMFQQMNGVAADKNVLLLVEEDYETEHQETDSSPAASTSRTPNLVTFNTLLDACRRVGDIGTALDVKHAMQHASVRPDERTYTSLIATVAARRRTNEESTRSQAKTRDSNLLHGNDKDDYPQDPLSLAFALFEEMKDQGIAPNGMTYSVLIDVAAKSRRSDLALQGLRLMLRDKKELAKQQRHSDAQPFVLVNEVGAWTAAINACGKSGRWETAVKLFHTMSSFGVEPNTVTCGCLMDTLLRYGQTAETLNVLRYMKEHDIAPSEVMYTSLIARAEHLAKGEHKSPSKTLYRSKRPEYAVKEEPVEDTPATRVYTELMKSLLETSGDRSTNVYASLDSKTPDPNNTLLLKVFLVLQEMKSVGVEPDLACFNALLRACARAGDVDRAQQVLEQILQASLVPDDTTWRQLLSAASRASRSDLALQIWKKGVAFRKKQKLIDERPIQWSPSVDSFSMLLSAHLVEAAAVQEKDMRMQVLRRVTVLYEKLLLGDVCLGLDRLDLEQVLRDQRAMLLALHAFVSLAQITSDKTEQRNLYRMTQSIIQLECLDNDAAATRLRPKLAQTLKVARSWSADSAS